MHTKTNAGIKQQNMCAVLEYVLIEILRFKRNEHRNFIHVGFGYISCLNLLCYLYGKVTPKTWQRPLVIWCDAVFLPNGQFFETVISIFWRFKFNF